MHCGGTWGPVMPFLICIFSQLPSPSSSELSAPLTTFLKYTQFALSMTMSMCMGIGHLHAHVHVRDNKDSGTSLAFKVGLYFIFHQKWSKFWIQVLLATKEPHAGKNATLLFVPRRLFFAAPQRIAITLSPKYYQKMQRSTTRKNQEEHGPDVM